ncbi:cupin domain-containing protein [Reinekea forsetii]|nr:cupin domain-containing protein [Reinekea forsetii]
MRVKEDLIKNIVLNLDCSNEGRSAKSNKKRMFFMSNTTDEKGAGHNHPKEEATWERWTKKRTFVRALEGTYGELVEELFNQPRVYSSTDWNWKGGPQNYGKKIINPQAVKVAQSIEAHLDCFTPGGYGQKHGHMNSAVFYILKGKGYDVHDTKRIDWEAGDALIVENGCVHQHFNDESDEEAVIVIFKAKPLFLFMHMMFQKVVDMPPKEVVPGQENYEPPAVL